MNNVCLPIKCNLRFVAFEIIYVTDEGPYATHTLEHISILHTKHSNHSKFIHFTRVQRVPFNVLIQPSFVGCVNVYSPPSTSLAIFRLVFSLHLPLFILRSNNNDFNVLSHFEISLSPLFTFSFTFALILSLHATNSCPIFCVYFVADESVAIVKVFSLEAYQRQFHTQKNSMLSQSSMTHTKYANEYQLSGNYNMLFEFSFVFFFIVCLIRIKMM